MDERQIQQTNEATQQEQPQQGRPFNIKDIVSFFMPKSLKEEQRVETEEGIQQSEELQAEDDSPEKQYEVDLQEVELPKGQGPPKDFNSFVQESQFVANQSNELFRQMTGKDYDPFTATLEEHELFNRVRDYVSEQLNQYTEQQAKIQRLVEFEQRFIQAEPRWQELVNYIQNEKPASVLLEIQQAIADADADKLNQMLTELRREFYARQGRPRTKEVPEPPFIERAGTEPPVVQQEFDPRQLRKASTFEERIRMIPLDLLAPKNILE